MDQKLKKDAGKLRYDLISPEAERSLAKVYTFGLEKGYKEESWRGVGLKRYIAAEKRHDYEYKKNHLSIDEESGLLHIEHKFWNVLTQLLFALEEQKQKPNKKLQSPPCLNCKHYCNNEYGVCCNAGMKTRVECKAYKPISK